ncbi:MAG TPA: MMPL family transporter [Gaiellaceae bacterium]|nr:MMPL family transporter [Gaiellaceae bacterium]
MKTNIAARAGRWSAAHWKTATFGWLALVAAATAAGMLVGTNKLGDGAMGTGGTAKAQRILADAGFERPAAESVLVQSKTERASSPRFRAVVDSVVSAVAERAETTNLRSPYRSGGGAIGADGRSALVEFEIVGDADTAEKRVQPVLASVARVQQAHPDFRIAQFGLASANHALSDTIDKDFQQAERLSVPIVFAILLVAFGAFVAAGMPVLLGLSAVLGSIGLSALVSHALPATDVTASVILLMGMAVGVDYALFYLKREREERSVGEGGRGALHRAAETSGQAVLISGVTVMIAMAGMLLAGSPVFTSIGVGAMIVVFLAMVGSLTVLPALLGKLEGRVDRGLLAVLAATLARLARLARWEPQLLVRLKRRRTVLQRLKGDRHESRLWGLVLRPALRFPALTACASAGLLVVLTLPVFGMHTRFASFADLPRDLKIVQSYEAIGKAFPGTPAPAHAVIKAPDVTAPRVRAAISDLKRQALATGVMHEPIETALSADRTVARVSIPLAGDGTDDESTAALKQLRNEVVPATIGAVPGAEVAVTGDAAGTYDFNETMKSHAPLVFAFVLGLAFLFLLLAFRSIVIPIKAIVLNLLSVGAAYGALVWIFQQGHLEGVLGFESNGAIVAWLPLFLFAVLFGLSMDYHVFILSRIKELVDHGLPTEQAVERGIRSTASTVTSAAAVMIAVFGIFAGLSTLDMKQLGVGLALAVLIDATIIRAVLLPASMKLLGRWNWYLPRRLEWLPRLTVEPVRREPGQAPHARPAPAFTDRRSARRQDRRCLPGCDDPRVLGLAHGAAVRRRCPEGAVATRSADEAALPRRIHRRPRLEAPFHLRLQPPERAVELELAEERQVALEGALAVGVRVSAMEGQVHSRPQLAQRQRSFDAAEARHVDVEEGDLRLLLQAHLNRLGAVCGLEDDDLAESLARTGGEQRALQAVVVRDQESNLPPPAVTALARLDCNFRHCALLLFGLLRRVPGSATRANGLLTPFAPQRARRGVGRGGSGDRERRLGTRLSRLGATTPGSEPFADA